MRRNLMSALLILCGAAMLSGCGHEHEWLEATCLAPKTCSTCEEIEGEPLGHDMTQATCTEPPKCSRCGFTEGSALDHDWTEPTFQTPATCTRCGATDGEPLGAEFAAYGLDSQFISLGETCDYHTICYDNTSATTTGKLTVTDYSIIESDDTHPAVDGYEWKIVSYKIEFNDDNSYFYGASVGRCSEDYYTTIERDSTVTKDEDGNFHFTVNFNGTDYSDCVGKPDVIEWVTSLSNKTISEYGTLTYLLPVGYDGQIVGWYSREHSWEEGMTIFDVATEDALFFRLDNQ